MSCRFHHSAASLRSTWLIPAIAALCLGFPLASHAQDEGCASQQQQDEQDQQDQDQQDQDQQDQDQQDQPQQPGQQGCPTPLSRALDAVEAYVTAPARWNRTDWLYFGGAVAAIGVAHHFDGTVRAQFADDAPVSVNAGSPDSLQDALPAAGLLLGTWGYAKLIDDEDGIREAHAMLEATTLSLGTAVAVSYIARREGPNQTTSPNRWLAAGSSFPSEHTTAAFAIGTVLAESGNSRYRWVRRVLGYGVAGFTVYERLEHNAHWLSDTVAGAALGAASARFAMNREQDAEQRGAFAVAPIRQGVMLTYTLKLQ